MQFIDRGLAHRLELTDAYGGVSFARALAAANPESGATAEPFAAGWAIFAGPGSPVTQAFALGLAGSVEEDEVLRLEAFFRSRGAPTNVELCPYADPTLVEIFRRRGYAPLEFSNVLARRIEPEDSEFRLSGPLQVRQPEGSEARVWAETVAAGFAADGAITEGIVDLFMSSSRSQAATYFLAEIDGQAAGGGVLVMHEGIASLGGASTLTAFRNRGVQTALMRARIAYAAIHGCDIAMVTTMPGTASQRNAERQGFRVVYTRTKLIKE